jgi:hypothetical protein
MIKAFFGIKNGIDQQHGTVGMSLNKVLGLLQQTGSLGLWVARRENG